MVWSKDAQQQGEHQSTEDGPNASGRELVGTPRRRLAFADQGITIVNHDIGSFQGAQDRPNNASVNATAARDA
jgi:hypothetical protein